MVRIRTRQQASALASWPLGGSRDQNWDHPVNPVNPVILSTPSIPSTPRHSRRPTWQSRAGGAGEPGRHLLAGGSPPLPTLPGRRAGPDRRRARRGGCPWRTSRCRPAACRPAALDALAPALGADAVSTSHDDRLLHAFGKSYRDLVRLRAGQVERAPDAVVYPPENEEAVLAVLRLAGQHGFSVVPFGGGSSVTGGLEALGDRPVVSLDLARLDRVLALDRVARDRHDPGRHSRPGAGGRPGRPGLHPGALSPELGVLLAGRLDRHPLGRPAVHRLRQDRGHGGEPDRGHAPPGCWSTRAGAGRRHRAHACASCWWAPRASWGSSPRPPCGCAACRRSATTAAWPFGPSRRDWRPCARSLQTGLQPVTVRLSDPAETQASLAMQRRHGGLAHALQTLGKDALARLGYDLRGGRAAATRTTGPAC